MSKAFNLHRWRLRNGLTQVEAASLLGVSQTYLSLLEKGARPLTDAMRSRLKAVRRDDAIDQATTWRAQLSALGYPGFAHVSPARPKPNPDSVLISILAGSDVDARVVDALPWLVRRFAGELDLGWLVRQAKLKNLQNRLGFVLQASRADRVELLNAIRELERARLMEEATLCWDSMPEPTREWIRANRTDLARHWNIATRLAAEDIGDAA